jgi:hypothetical protein
MIAVTAMVGVTAGLIGGLLARPFWHTSRRLLHVSSADSIEEESRVRSLTLVDDSGRQRAFLGVISGTTSLLLVGDQRSVLRFAEREVNFRLGIGILEDGSSGLELTDLDGRERASLRLRASGAVSFALRDRNGNVRGSFDVPPEGNPSLVLFDSQGNTLTKLP